MSFFMNPFNADFIAPWVLGDRQYNQDFKCPRNAGRGEEWAVSYGTAPFNLSGNDSDGNAKNVLNISFAVNDFKNWADLAITISGASMSAITAAEAVSSLNSNAVFADFFTASLNQTRTAVQIQQKLPCVKMRFYIKKGQAETVMLFNKFIGVAELPTYFARHTVANRFTYTDSQNAIIALDTGLNVDSAIINNAVDFRGNSLNYSSGTVQADWQLLRGKVGIFAFKKLTIDGSGRITRIIEYPAGALAGDLGRKTDYTYTSTNTNPDQVTEQPYTLTNSDLVTPP